MYYKNLFIEINILQHTDIREMFSTIFKRKLFANHSLQKFVFAITCCGQYHARNWNWIGLYWNRFKLTKLLSSDINIPKWGFHTWNNGHSCHLCSVQYIFQRVNRNCMTLKKKIIPRKYRCVIKVISRDQSNPIFRGTCTSTRCGLLNVFLPAFSEVANFSRHYLVSRRQIPRCVETVRCLSAMGGRVFRMQVLHVHARRCYEILRRGTSRKALLNASPTIYARAHTIASIRVAQNRCFHLFRT